MEFQLKTNINCASCVATVTPIFQLFPEITTWSVDTTSPNKILTLHTDEQTLTQLKEKLFEKGYFLEPVVS